MVSAVQPHTVERFLRLPACAVAVFESTEYRYGSLSVLMSMLQSAMTTQNEGRRSEIELWEARVGGFAWSADDSKHDTGLKQKPFVHTCERRYRTTRQAGVVAVVSHRKLYAQT